MLSDTWWALEHSGLENLLKWLLDAEWSKHGVDLATTFRHILSRSMEGTRERKLNSLYLASEHIPGAAAEIEKFVFSANFSRGHDRVESSWEKGVIEEIKEEKLRRLLFPHPRKLSPSAMLAEAVALEGAEDVPTRATPTCCAGWDCRSELFLSTLRETRKTDPYIQILKEANAEFSKLR